MFHRLLINGARGLSGSLVLFPIAEWWEGRDIRGKRRLLAREMANSFAIRRGRAWTATVETVQFAAAKVPYYRDLFARIGFDPDSLLRDQKFLNDIPYLTKDTIRNEGERLLREDHADRRKHLVQTGGSTGPSVCIYHDDAAIDWSSAVTWYARTLIGAGSIQSEMHFASRFPERFGWRARAREYFKCLSNNRHNIFFSSFQTDELEVIWRRIKSIRPNLVHGHPSTLYQLALHVETTHQEERAFNIFESSGELLESNQRKVIARAFGCKIVDRYGLAEIGVAAYQTDPQRADMFVFDQFAWPEIAVEAGGLSDGEPHSGEIVLTGLKNRMMPLIRYRTGDLATLRETPVGFTFSSIVGRIHDVVEIAGRRLPTHYIQDLFDRIDAVQQFQIEVRNGRPTFRVVPKQGTDIKAIHDRLIAWWGDAVDVEFIDPTGLNLQGWRAKFRHLVTNPGRHVPQP
jgi:phenylacetate-CoA ligase